MHMYKIILLTLLTMSISCISLNNSDNTADESGKIQYLDTAITIDDYDIIMFPIIQNYISSNNKELKIKTNPSWLPSSSSSRLPSNQCYTNIYWRNISSKNESFKKLFEKDLYISEYFHSNIPDDNTSKTKPAFIVFEGVESDTDNDGFIDPSKDTVSLYIFNLLMKKVKRITPATLNVSDIKHKGFISSYVGSSSSHSFILSTPNENNFKLNEYVILFEGIENNKKSIYLYHLQSEYLENISNQINYK